MSFEDDKKVADKGLDYNLANSIAHNFRFSEDHRDAWARRNEDDSNLWDILIPEDVPMEEYEEFRKNFEPKT